MRQWKTITCVGYWLRKHHFSYQRDKISQEVDDPEVDSCIEDTNPRKHNTYVFSLKYSDMASEQEGI